MKNIQKKLSHLLCMATFAASPLTLAATIHSTGFEASDGFNDEGSGYIEGVYITTPDGAVWSSDGLRTNNNAIWSRQNHTNGGTNSVVFGNDGHFISVDPSGSDGISHVSFWYTSYSSTTDATIDVQWTADNINGNEVWTTAHSYSVAGNEGVWQQVTAHIYQTGDIKLRWLVNGTKGNSIDDVIISDYIPPIAAQTSFESVDGFTADSSGNKGGFDIIAADDAHWLSGSANLEYAGAWSGQNNTSDGLLSAVIGNSGQYLISDPAGATGVGAVDFSYTSYTHSSDAIVNIQWTTDSLDGDETWATVDTYQLNGMDNSWHSHTATINQTGDVKIRWIIEGTGGNSIDDITISPLIKVATIGDSITFGLGLSDDSEKYPTKLQSLLGAAAYQVGNFGHSGARVSTLDKDTAYMETTAYDDAVAFEADVIFIALGINDCSPDEWDGKNKNVFLDDYNTLIENLKKSGKKPTIYIGSLMPVFSNYTGNYNKMQAQFGECQSYVTQVASNNNLPLIDLFEPLESKSDYYPDGIHPDANGTAIIADMACKAITDRSGGL